MFHYIRENIKINCFLKINLVNKNLLIYDNIYLQKKIINNIAKFSKKKVYLKRKPFFLYSKFQVIKHQLN